MGLGLCFLLNLSHINEWVIELKMMGRSPLQADFFRFEIAKLFPKLTPPPPQNQNSGYVPAHPYPLLRHDGVILEEEEGEDEGGREGGLDIIS